jgi:diguanylate cyclase (GGDEF)-like protein/PAS domain S-box-containing protein
MLISKFRTNNLFTVHTQFFTKTYWYHFLSLSILIGGLAFSFIAFNSIHSAEAIKTDESFRRSVQTYTAAISQGLSQDLLLVRAINAHFSTGEKVTPENFHSFTAPLLTRYPGIQALEWAPKIASSQLSSFEAEARVHSPNFRVTERLQQGEMIPVTLRPEYFPVFLVEPLHGNEIAQGFDLGSNTARRQSIQEAMQSGDLSITSKITLVQEKNWQVGFLVMSPIYLDEGTATRSTKISNFRGVVLGVFRIKDVIDSAIAPLKPTGINFAIYEDESITPKSELYKFEYKPNANQPDLIESDKSGFLSTELEDKRSIEFNGKKWTVVFTPSSGYFDTSVSGYALVTLLAEIFATVALSYYIQVMRKHSETLEENQKLLTKSQEIAHLGNWEWNKTTNKVVWSQEMFNILGLDPHTHKATYDTFFKYIHREDLKSVVTFIDQILNSTSNTQGIEYRVNCANNQTKYVRSDIQAITNSEGVIIGLSGIMSDVTKRREDQESLLLASMVYQNSIESIFATDAHNCIISVNPAFTELTGYSAKDVIGKNPSILNSKQHDIDFFQSMWESINVTGVWQGEIWNKHKNGNLYAIWLSIRTIYAKDGSVFRRLGLATDITQKKRNEEIIWRQANFDALTQLPNRRMIYEKLHNETKRASRYKFQLAVLFIDLDLFKKINDTFGHEKGDFVLKKAAHRMSSCIRETDIVGRLGGDEFIVILSEIRDLADVSAIAEKLTKSLSQPYVFTNSFGDPTLAHLSCSIGISFFPKDANDDVSLIKNADSAMYESKLNGRNRFSIFSAKPNDQIEIQKFESIGAK